MKKLYLLIAVLTLGTAACSDSTAPVTEPVARPTADGSPCVNGGYVGSDGKWVCY